MRYYLRHLFSLILPFTAVVLIPYVLLEERGARAVDESVVASALFFMGAASICLGIYLLALTIRAFAVKGRGTLAPWSPTSRLVVEGVYAYVRNPMISAVLFILLGEAMVFLSLRLFAWFVAFFIINNIYFTISEEPALIRRFGTDYEEYKANVPKWLPRMKPWRREKF